MILRTFAPWAYLLRIGDEILSPGRKTSSRTLPADLKDEIILFLKFDSVDVPLKRPKGYAKTKFIKYTNHNKMVPELNKELRQIAAKYPFRYKIISMMDKNYAGHGAKYLLWMNTFDAFTDGVVYTSGIHREGFGATSTYSATGMRGGTWYCRPDDKEEIPHQLANRNVQDIHV